MKMDDWQELEELLTEGWDEPREPDDAETSSHDHRCPGCGALHLCVDLDCFAPYETECLACL